MKHSIDKQSLGEFGEPIIEAVDKCVHCGFCLPTCPTYMELGQEMDSPRGRIVLMKNVLEGNFDFADAEKYLDRCLGCLGCETSCPSGVEYGKLITPFRVLHHQNQKRGWLARFCGAFLHRALTHPRRFRLAARLGILVRPGKGMIPRSFMPSLEMLPERLPGKVVLPEISQVDAEQKHRVALLAGCGQQVLAPEINLATIRVLNRHGCEVVIPREQVCCGALDWHNGFHDRAKKLATRNLKWFNAKKELDAIIVNAAGCGSAIKDYGVIFAGEKNLSAASTFAKLSVEITMFLDRIGYLPPSGFDQPTKVAYQDACHLAHAQQIRSVPRQLLRSVPNLELVSLPEAEICCGSAGTYNLQQPEIAAELGRRKAKLVVDSGCEIVASGNIGCIMQLRRHLKELDSSIRVCHTIELL